MARAYAAVLLMLTFGGIVIEDRYKQLFTCKKTRWGRGVERRLPLTFS